MSDKPTGGPAFPVPSLLHDEDFNGMSLRDYFAAKAMQAIVATVPHLAEVNPVHVAEEAYEYADAMLNARQV